MSKHSQRVRKMKTGTVVDKKKSKPKPKAKVTTAKKAKVMSAEATKQRRAKAKATPKGKKISTKDAFKTAFKDQPTPAERAKGITMATTINRERITAVGAAPLPKKKKRK